MREPAGDQLSPEPGKRGRQDRGGHGDREEGDRVRAQLAAQLAHRLGAGQVRNDDHPERLSAEHQDEVDAVGGHEPVGLDVATELVGEERAGNGGGEAQCHI